MATAIQINFFFHLFIKFIIAIFLVQLIIINSLIKLALYSVIIKLFFFHDTKFDFIIILVVNLKALKIIFIIKINDVIVNFMVQSKIIYLIFK